MQPKMSVHCHTNYNLVDKQFVYLLYLATIHQRYRHADRTTCPATVPPRAQQWQLQSPTSTSQPYLGYKNWPS